MAVTTARRGVVRLSGADRSIHGDEVAVESPLVLGLSDGVDGGVLATLMRTPGHDIELAAGWLVVESGVRAPEDIAALRACWQDDTDRVNISLRPGVVAPRPRAFISSSACGVCSADLIDLAPHRHAPPHTPGWSVERSVLASLPSSMRTRQRGFAKTGGMHAASLATVSGELLWVAEDVGRHNAVDKVIGRALLDGRLPATDHLLVVSSRVSFEIVQKAVAAGVAAIVAVSAPSSLAVDLCREHDLLLAGLVRGESLNIYAGEELLS